MTGEMKILTEALQMQEAVLPFDEERFLSQLFYQFGDRGVAFQQHGNEYMFSKTERRPSDIAYQFKEMKDKALDPYGFKVVKEVKGFSKIHKDKIYSNGQYFVKVMIVDKDGRHLIVAGKTTRDLDKNEKMAFKKHGWVWEEK
jgi:hypothetical protein